eukprot:TRINITY_DN3557_c0_g2_i14.p1 TRINITY_DN3557_c0_g2~~TRINITY_DN3557_c0_g2_i14.p1  ORF type:complete len:174 (-),score=27.79 TRINITY_DN3557_c0_g2_i14:140-661(-)
MQHPYSCLQCGRKICPVEEDKANAKEDLTTATDDKFYKHFNVLEKENTSLNTLEIEHGPSEWRDLTKKPRKYHLAFVDMYNAALADRYEENRISAKELTKSLFADLSTMSETLGAEHLYVALFRNSPQFISTVRSLLVYGCEKIQSEEQMKFTSNSDIMMFKLELAQVWTSLT